MFVSKGGATEETAGRKCICNALMATAGHPQIRAGKIVEQGVVTSGDDLKAVKQYLRDGATDYSAADVIAALKSAVPA